jgi:RNA polymerase primary sigma factor
MSKGYEDTSDSRLNTYLSEISKIPLLTPAEEKELGRQLIKYRNDTSNHDKYQHLTNKLVRHNLRFVVDVAKQYYNGTVSLLDIIQDGNCGLIRAAHKYDPSKDCRFISYAVYWIKNEILKELSQSWESIRLPLNLQNEFRSFANACNEVSDSVIRYEDLGDILPNMTKEKYHLFVHHFNHSQIVSLQNPLFESSSSETLEDTIAGTYRTPTQKVMGDILAKSTNDLLDKLPNLKATVIRFRLGFNGRPLKLND